MKTADFINSYCIGTTCPDFDYRYGCRAYDGEECDEAFNHPIWRGLKMADRVTKLCERKGIGKFLKKNFNHPIASHPIVCYTMWRKGHKVARN